jgi:NAD-dependent DNA ligase
MSTTDEMQKFHDEIVGQEMSSGAPFDDPAPKIDFAGNSFMFTGKFEFGTRKACQNAVTERGGSTNRSTTGTRGSNKCQSPRL